MGVVKSFRELNVYQLSRDATQRIFELSKGFPIEERYSLTDQIRRSSRAVKAMIAEAWARRRYKAVFVNKLDEALGEATESQSWLDDARDAKYISVEEFDILGTQYVSITRMLSRMIDRSADFCKHAPSTDYRTLRARVEEDQPAEDTLADLSEFLA
jgi:four helix bundle protein